MSTQPKGSLITWRHAWGAFAAVGVLWLTWVLLWILFR
jgi:hypothetical protein